MSLGSSSANQRVELYDNDSELKVTVKPAGSDNALVVTAAGSTANYPSTTSASWGSITVTDSATLIASQDISRISFKLTNYGLNRVFLGFNNTVTTANGFPLDQGDVYEQVITDLYQGAIYCICETGKTSDVRWVTYQ
jgi:hypothetical protein